MLHAVESGAGGIHPAGENPLFLLVGTVIVNLDEGRGFRRLAGRGGIAIARDDGEGGEFDRLADRRHDVGGLTRDLVQAAQQQRGPRRVGKRRGWRALERPRQRLRPAPVKRAPVAPSPPQSRKVSASLLPAPFSWRRPRILRRLGLLRLLLRLGRRRRRGKA